MHGKPYADVMRERLFQPLGMTASTLRPLEALTRDFSQGHEGDDAQLKVVRPMAENTAQYPAGSVVLFGARAGGLLAVAAVGGEGGLTDGAVRTFFTADVPLPGGDGARYGFGLVSYPIAGTHGVRARRRAARLRIAHSLPPGRRGAVVLLTNRNGVTLRSLWSTSRPRCSGSPSPRRRRRKPPP